MSKNAYIGVEGVARKVKKMYVGVDGVAREVKKAYVGVDGVARLFYQNVINISAAVVTLGANLTYNGKSQTKAVSSVVLDGVTLVAGVDYTVSGNTGTNAGNYTLTITGIGDYEGTVTAAWSIAKATGKISVSPTSLSFTGMPGTSKTATISYTGDGSISVKSSATGVATVSRSGTTISVKSVAKGSATITVTLAAGTNYTGASCTISISVSTALSGFTWAQIAEISASGKASTYFAVGDTKSVSLNGTSYSLRIIGFDHDNLNSTDAKYGDSSYNGGSNKAGITLEMAACYKKDYLSGGSDDYYMWSSNHARSKTLPEIKSYMPSELQSVLRTVTKLSYNVNSSPAGVKTSTDDLFLLSEIEVRNSYTNSNAGEGKQYAYYAAGNSKIKKFSGTSIDWWLRSQGKVGSGAARKAAYITTGGSASTAYGDEYYGISPAFCI